jgi:hypothetical protein
MALKTAQVMAEIVAIKISDSFEPFTTRGEGVAFWCDVNGATKLVTAAHIAWPGLKSIPTNEVLDVRWATAAGSGQGQAAIIPHTPHGDLDFAEISYLSPSGWPPSGYLFPCGAMPDPEDRVACVGFPGPFVVPPQSHRTNGTVDFVTGGLLSTEAQVTGSAGPGYSGGPVFLVDENDDLSDYVVGLMRGAPPLPNAMPGDDGKVPHDPNKWVFFGAVSFK